MSSWIKNQRGFAVKNTVKSVEYYLVEPTQDCILTFLDVLAAYIFSLKMGERPVIVDPSNLLLTVFKNQSQIQYLKAVPEVSSEINSARFTTLIPPPKFTEIKRYASGLFIYDDQYNRILMQSVEKAGIKTLFDLGVHLHSDLSGSQIPSYINEVRVYQKKTKKASLSIYIMADQIELIQHFIKLGDPSWKVTTTPKTSLKSNLNDPQTRMTQVLAEVKILTVQPALILDFTDPIDRYIHLMHRNQSGPDYLKVMSTTDWYLI
jgi:hypothetical protein